MRSILVTLPPLTIIRYPHVLSTPTGQDEWVSKAVKQRMESAIRKAGRPLQTFTYSGTGHWFAESSRPGEYDAAAAHLALERTVQHLRATLSASLD